MATSTHHCITVPRDHHVSRSQALNYELRGPVHSADERKLQELIRLHCALQFAVVTIMDSTCPRLTFGRVIENIYSARLPALHPSLHNFHLFKIFHQVKMSNSIGRILIRLVKSCLSWGPFRTYIQSLVPSVP